MAKEFKETNKESRESKKKGATSVTSAIEQDQAQSQSQNFKQNESEGMSFSSGSQPGNLAGNQALDTFRNGIENVRAIFSEENMDRARQGVLHQMNQRPFMTMSVALGAGYLLGSVIPRRLEKYLFSIASASALDWVTGRNLSQGGLASRASNVFNMKGASNEQFGTSH